ncbi:unnamed protein product [Vitrella brassicaformis CCMP3155]|uniref:Uncharacterized protein n=1 Tax=Vitrella brassicaformis (strain CCMP3155) TaxID=1169540 RepID=A0A0G4ENX2_VITBC|nr:unnamed protein product [Vitrella brassicaformis CCMP3155]|eukprot:CEL99114.1 unnamed protein product [Vitrella brassicaformis CCMP3155]
MAAGFCSNLINYLIFYVVGGVVSRVIVTLAISHATRTAPTTLSYGYGGVTTLSVGIPMPELRPTWECGVPLRFESDVLPLGLTLNERTGVLAGTPQVESAEKIYMIHAISSTDRPTARASAFVGLEVRPAMQLLGVNRTRGSPVLDVEVMGLETTYCRPYQVSAVVVPSHVPLTDILCQMVPVLSAQAYPIIPLPECSEEQMKGGEDMCFVSGYSSADLKTLHIDLMGKNCCLRSRESDALKVVGLVTLKPDEHARRDVPLIREYLNSTAHRRRLIDYGEDKALMIGFSEPKELPFTFGLEPPSATDWGTPYSTTIQLDMGKLRVSDLRQVEFKRKLEEDVEKLLGVPDHRIGVVRIHHPLVDEDGRVMANVIFLPDQAKHTAAPYVMFEDFWRRVMDPRSHLYQNRPMTTGG